jgi:hypothetical protein
MLKIFKITCVACTLAHAAEYLMKPMPEGIPFQRAIYPFLVLVESAILEAIFKWKP